MSDSPRQRWVGLVTFEGPAALTIEITAEDECESEEEAKEFARDMLARRRQDPDEPKFIDEPDRVLTDGELIRY